MVFLVVVTISSCKKSQVISTFQEIENNVWKYDDIKKDSVTITDDNFYHTLNVNLRIKGNYPYSNLYVRIYITNPEGEKKTLRTSLKLADKYGKWYGSGFGDLITFQIPLKNRKHFTQKGTYHLGIEQFMRTESLEDVNAIGFMILKQEEIF
jgi:gliding motility-associated lipoprotein GldH